MPPAGIIEGFYGPPWSWDERAALLTWAVRRGLAHYVHAPKDDPVHRERWRDPWSADHLDGFARLAAETGAVIGVGISPGLSMAYEDPDDRRALAAKVDAAVGAGAALVALCLDDIEPRPGLGEDHARLTAWLHEHLGGRAELVLVPTEYTGARPTPYLDALAAGVPEAVPVGWTGATVVADEVPADLARARAECLGGRPPLLWDNYPVNDVLMADRLFLGPVRGRDHELVGALWGWFANPMVQPRCSRPALASVAALVRDEDPEAAWAEEVGDQRALAEACDGEVPRRLVDEVLGGGPAEPVRAWLDELLACDPGPLSEEAAPWTEQARTEARLCRSALRLLADGRGPSTAERAVGLAAAWAAARRAEATVFGSRCSVRPVLSQDESGRWALEPGFVEVDANATDRLVAEALRRTTSGGR